MEQTKSERYLELITKFKTHVFKDPRLKNPHHIEGFNFDVINPWELWHNNLDAKILFIGQDFSDTTSLEHNLKNNWKKEKSSSTNNNLIDLFSILGYGYNFDKVDYNNQIKYPIFFTNAILGIKVTDNQNMSLPVKDEWWKETCREYLKALIDIIQPKHIIAMSMVAYKAIGSIYNLKLEKSVYEAIANNGKRKLPNGSDLFIVSHCSPNGLMKRSIETQAQDWLRLRNYMEGVLEESESLISSNN
ncbi:uracil-DNA glycosylase family protein [Mucilaginibacter paludis]|uniref:Uracil-DNA glycosylase-like domain-containing protein n=1 Tax=Mucilaginibacter paludis DSM 18603 TaxID=714943 RepID=H1Y6K2_9SPHI|nr:uracil-DNA glycosylase family protein [Mucilaginibacter paludis]EHQ25846.1 hypothetical protein Mucpa_1691 [Mucilaginibacter paludis DSM 18603]